MLTPSFPIDPLVATMVGAARLTPLLGVVSVVVLALFGDALRSRYNRRVGGPVEGGPSSVDCRRCGTPNPPHRDRCTYCSSNLD